MARKGTSKFEPQIADPDGVSIDAVTGQPMAIPLDAEAPPMEDSGVPAQVAEDAVSDQSPLKGMAALQAVGGTSDYAKMLLDKLNDPEYKKNKLEADRLAKQSILEQQQGLAQNQQALQGLETQGPGTNLMPLYQLSDNLTGSKFAQNYKQPESPQELAMKLYGMRDQLQKQRQGVTQEQLARMKALTDMGGLKELAMIGRLGQRQQSIDLSNSKYANQTVDKDPILNTYTQRLDGANKALDLIKGAETGDFKKTNAFLHQLNIEIARLESGSAAVGENTIEGISMKDNAAQFKSIVDAYTGAPSDAVRQKVLDQAKGQIGNLSNSYKNQINNRYTQLSSGKTSTQKKIIGDKFSTFNQQYGKSQEPQSQDTSELNGAPLSFEEWQKAGKPKAGK